MKIPILFVCMFASIYCNQPKKYNFNVQLEDVKYSNIPEGKYDLFYNKKGDIIPFEAFKNINFDKGINPRAIHATLNEYADKIFANIDAAMVHSGLDPMEMPDLHTGFNFTFIITYHGELDLNRGWLSDTSTLHRGGGDCVVEYSSNTKYLQVTVPIAFEDLQFTYDYHAKLMNLGPDGSIDGKVTDVRVEVKIGFDMNTFKASLDEFAIVNSGHISVHFSGNILTDWIVNLLSDVVTTLLKPVILGIVQDIIKGGLTSAVDAINSFVDSILNPVPATTTAAPEMARHVMGNLHKFVHYNY